MQVNDDADVWDTTDPLNPQPRIYPTCSGCGDAYQYVRHLSLATGRYVWAWAKPAKQVRGCRHKQAPEMHSDRSDDGKA